MFGLFALAMESGLSFWERLAAWYEGSLFKEILTYLNDRYFTIEFGIYENFAMGEKAGITARNMVLAVALGLMIAAIMIARLRTIHGAFVRKLLALDCTSPEKAKTLAELGEFDNVTVRRDLARGNVLRMVVRCREDDEEKWLADANPKNENVEAKDQGLQEEAGSEEKTAEFTSDCPQKAAKQEIRKPDFTTAHFYIPEDLRYRAEIRFDAKGSGWLPVIAVVLLTVLASAAICWFLPDVVAFADNLISIFTP